jgi:UDP-N-acetylmuramyl tripeptide synthase
MSSGSTVQRTPAASARRAIAVWMGKATHSGVRRLSSGRGAAIPGRVALAIDPAALTSLTAEMRRGSILVTGSAGKSTTCQLLAPIIRAAGLHLVLSTDGSGQRSALAAAMVAHAAPTGHMRRASPAIGLFEVSSGSLAEIVRHVAGPAAIVCTNIFPDAIGGQRRRDSGATALARAIRTLPATTTLILNADDPGAACLGADLPNPRLYFGVSDPACGRVREDPTSDFPRCPRCDAELTYNRVYYAHLGHWDCGGCGLSRPRPDVSITRIEQVGSSSARLHLTTPAGPAVLRLPLPGLYNAYNALAALAAARHCQLPGRSLAAIEQAPAGSGRMERVTVTGREVYLALGTNATGYTEVLRAVLGDGEPKRMLLGLSDRPDASWIWTVDFESLAGLVPGPVITGDGAAKLAVRLKYAGWLGDGQDRGQSAGAIIEPDPVRAFQAAMTATPPGQPLWVVSTSAELRAIRRWLRQRGFVQADRRARGHLTSVQQPTGPQLTGPQPSAPPVSGRRPNGRTRYGRRPPRQAGQTGAGR